MKRDEAGRGGPMDRPLSSFTPYRSSLNISAARLDIVEDPHDGVLCIVDSARRADAISDGWRIIREDIPGLSQAERIKERLVRHRHDTDDTAYDPDSP